MAGWLWADAATVREALLVNAPAAALSLCSWNVQWLVDATPDAAVKRHVVDAALQRGRVVCLQETHWADHEAAI